MPKPPKDFLVHVVLVRSIYESNVGAASRAMSNMGGDRLILVGPQCEFTFTAQQAAASGQDGLKNKTVYANWAEFMENEDAGIRIAFSARDGRGRKVQDMALVYEQILATSPFFQVDKGETAKPVSIYLVFGPEDWGLSAEDLDLMHFCACIPTFGPNWSLNLAQAVMVALYELRKSWGGTRTLLDGEIRTRDSAITKEIFPEQTLRIWLEELGYDLSKPKMNVFKILNRMLLQNTPTNKELTILETVLQQNIRKLREWKKTKKD